MKKFYLHGLLYGLPLFLFVAVIIVIDPYYLFNSSREFDQNIYNIGYSYDQGRRYKLFTYHNNPTDKIVLGASEINVINERNIPEPGWHSLSFGGAPLRETLDLLEYMIYNNEIKQVVLAPEFIKYYLSISYTKENVYMVDNYRWNTCQAYQAINIFNNKAEYFLDRNTIKSTYSYMQYLCGISVSRGIPQMSKEQFWSEQLLYALNTYENNIIDKKMQLLILNRFKEIKNIADEYEVEIKIVIPIQHVELVNIEYTDRVYPYYLDYLKKLVDIFGEIYYFDYPNEKSLDYNLFSDPFHYTDSDIYINTLWQDDYSFCLKLNENNIDKHIEDIRIQIKNY